MTDNPEFQFFQKALLAHDAPAFIRRAREMEFAWEHLLERCALKREELLEFPRLRLGMLFASVQDARQDLDCVCREDDIQYLQKLHGEWSPRLRVDVKRARSPRVIRSLLFELMDSFNRFNRRWSEFIDAIDLSRVNKLREDYNKYYVLEKECAVWSSAVARQRFVPMTPACHDALYEIFPLLKIIEATSS